MRWLFTGWLAVAAVALAGSAPERASRPPEPGEFHFVRMYYDDYGGARGGFGRFGGGGRGWWQQDWDDAEVHFTANLKRLTRINVGTNQVVDLLDERLFDYPWLYATQTGYWDLSDEELVNLREYLLRGGFLMCDDFWGEDEWYVFAETMRRLFHAALVPGSGHGRTAWRGCRAARGVRDRRVHADSRSALPARTGQPAATQVVRDLR
jgi:hypothetical protein